MKRFVAWLRGINVGAAGKGRKSVPMAELRALAEQLGFHDPRTHLQSGNLVFAAPGATRAHATALEDAIAEHFGFDVPVVVSTARDVETVEASCPFADEAETRPKLVHVGFCKTTVSSRARAGLEPYCHHGERVAIAARHLWIDFVSGVARSKLTPAVLDRCAGAPVTLRNMKTLRAVSALLRSGIEEQ